MSFVLIHADPTLSVGSNEPVVPAASLPAFHDALALLDHARDLRDAAERQGQEAYEAGEQAGLAHGARSAEEAGEAAWRGELFKLAMRDGQERQARRGEVATLAIEVVRRIAGEIGDAAILAGIAERACADLLPDAAATVRVPEGAVALASERLGAFAGISVQADPTLRPTECIVETALGTTHAGLDIQLGQLEAAWREVRHG